MDASVALHPAENPRNRSLEARRALAGRFKRDRLVVDFLNRGLSVVEIAQRLGVTEKRMRAIVREILARRMPQPPEEYVAMQASRLNEALLVAYSAMSPENLKAVDQVVRIVREFDRYHGFVAAGRLALPPPGRCWRRAKTGGVESRNATVTVCSAGRAILPASKQRATPHPGQ